MDQDKLSFFISRYKALDGDELAELHGRRDSLADEAVLALDTVLSDKGINKDILASYSEKPPETSGPSLAELTRQLQQGKLAIACKFAFLMTAWSPVERALDRSGVLVGSLWISLLTVALGYVGYRVGSVVTKAICIDERTTYVQKKHNLWFLLLGVTVLYFVLFLVAGLITTSVK